MTLRTKYNGKQWEHWSRTFHPTQALVLYDFTSSFDNGVTGRRVARTLRQAISKNPKFPGIDEKALDRVVKEKEFVARIDALTEDIAAFSRNNLGAGITVWGNVERNDDGDLDIHVKATDVRKKRILPFYEEEFEAVTPEDYPDMMKKVMAAIDRGSFVVKHLRIKIDAYWPAGIYYFDNMTLTEEGMHTLLDEE